MTSTVPATLSPAGGNILDQVEPVLTARHLGERAFEVVDAAGRQIMVDGSHGGGPGPMDLVVAALATCTGITMVELLAKMRQPLLSFSVAAGGERAEQAPRPWKRIHLEYRLEGVFDPARAERAAFLTETKHCPVSMMLAPLVPITHSIVRWGLALASIAAEEARPLRRELLRPHQTIEEMRYPGDDDPDTIHFGAIEDGRLVGIASLYREPPADWELPGEAWKLRGMATVPEVRGRGYGRALLRTCLVHARLHEGTVVWCKARQQAIGFYRRHGFSTRGELFEVPVIGPHVLMVCPLTGADRPPR